MHDPLVGLSKQLLHNLCVLHLRANFVALPTNTLGFLQRVWSRNGRGRFDMPDNAIAQMWLWSLAMNDSEETHRLT